MTGSIPELSRIEVMLEYAGQRPGPPQPNSRAIHAALHRLFETEDREYSRYLHNAVPKPIALAINGSGQPRVTFQLSLLTADANRVCGSALLRALASKPTIELDYEPYVLTSLRARPVGNFPSSMSYLELIERSDPVRRVRLAFVTPTTIRNDSRSFCSIEPRHVFGSGFINRWRAFAGDTPSVDTGAETLGAIELADGAMHERKVDLGKFGAKAFTGWAEYRVPELVSPMKSLAVLANFACFAGVGSRTAYGLGNVVRMA